MPYATLAHLKSYLNVTTNADDALLAALLERAQAAIESFTARRFEGVAATRKYGRQSIRGGALWLSDDLLSATSIVNGDGHPVAAYRLVPANPPHHSIEITDGAWQADAQDIVVVGVWGYSSAPPADVVHACIRLAAYFYRQRDAQVFDVTALPNEGIMTIPKGLPADVKQIIDRYRRLT